MNNKRLHGLHNNELCDLLIGMGNEDFLHKSIAKSAKQYLDEIRNKTDK